MLFLLGMACVAYKSSCDQLSSAQVSSASASLLISLEMRSISSHGETLESVAVWQTFGLDVTEEVEPYNTFKHRIGKSECNELWQSAAAA